MPKKNVVPPTPTPPKKMKRSSVKDSRPAPKFENPAVGVSMPKVVNRTPVPKVNGTVKPSISQPKVRKDSRPSPVARPKTPKTPLVKRK